MNRSEILQVGAKRLGDVMKHCVLAPSLGQLVLARIISWCLRTATISEWHDRDTFINSCYLGLSRANSGYLGLSRHKKCLHTATASARSPGGRLIRLKLSEVNRGQQELNGVNGS